MENPPNNLVRKNKICPFTERKTEGQRLNALHEPTQDLNEYLGNPTSLKVFSGNQELPLLSLVKLLTLSWMGHRVPLTFLKDTQLHDVTGAFTPRWHTRPKLFHLNPRWTWSCPFSISCVAPWLSQGSVCAVTLSRWEVLCNSVITRGMVFLQLSSR